MKIELYYGDDGVIVSLYWLGTSMMYQCMIHGHKPRKIQYISYLMTGFQNEGGESKWKRWVDWKINISNGRWRNKLILMMDLYNYIN